MIDLGKTRGNARVETRVELSGKTWLDEKLDERLDERLGKRLGERLGETRAWIVLTMKENPKVTGASLAEQLGISITAVEKHIKQLRAGGWVRRTGPAKGGYWEVLK